MEIGTSYLQLPHDLSGSLSKNRFRVELLWGISKMLDLMEGGTDFVVVFDYVCDVEVHYADGFEFYQIKTHNSKTLSCSCNSLVGKKVDAATGSILGKLYVLKTNNSNVFKLAVVSNVALKVAKEVVDADEYCFASLPVGNKEEIESALRRELSVAGIDLSNVYYMHTNMDLKEPEDAIKGKIDRCFQAIKNSEPDNPNALHRLIMDTVKGKACYEYSCDDYVKLLEKKGISRNELNEMLNVHAKNEKTGISQTKDYIASIKNLTQQMEYLQALARVLKLIPTDKGLKVVEIQVVNYLKKCGDIGTIEAATEQTMSKFDSLFPIEYSSADKRVYLMIVINKFVQGGCSNANAI